MDDHDPALLKLAFDALQAVISHDEERAGKAVQAISDQFGAGGLTTAIVAWCDTLAAQHPAAAKAGTGSAQLAWTSDEGGVEFADEMDGPDRWAGQFIMARASMDHATCSALIEALPHDGRAIGDYVGALLETVAQTLLAIRDGRMASALARARNGEDTPGNGED